MKKGVLITGGSRGIGAAAVDIFTKNGWNAVFIYEKSDDAAKAVADRTGATAIKADVADTGALRSAVGDAAVCLGGSIDALVCCAGIAQHKQLCDITDDDWNRMIAVNLTAPFMTTRAAAPYMIRKKHGAIVFVSSIWGIAGASCESHYSTAKAGLHGLTKALAKELGPSGIRVNCVAPGVIDTDMNASLDRETIDELCCNTPLGRIGTPEEAARAIYWLASDDASFVTGQIISPNGGFVV